MLYKISEGVLWDIEQREESGAAQLPKGGEFGNVDEISGKTEQVSTNGYNLLDVNDRTWESGLSREGVMIDVVDGTFVLNGTSTKAWVGTFMTSVSYPAGEYTLSLNNPIAISGNSVQIRVVAGENIATYANAVNNTARINATSPITGFAIRFETGITFNNFAIKPMLEKGSTAHTYEPYTGGIASPNPEYPQPIHSVEQLKVVRHGKNLLKLSEDLIAEKYGASKFTFGAGGEISVTLSSNWGSDYFICQPIKLPKGIRIYSSLYLSLRTTSFESGSGCKYIVRILDKDGNIITDRNKAFSNGDKMYWTSYNTFYKAFTLKPQSIYNDSYVSVSFILSDAVESVMCGICFSGTSIGDYGQAKEFMFYIGDNSDYEPYKEPIERTITPPRPLNAIGGYKDVCDVVGGVFAYEFAVADMGVLTYQRNGTTPDGATQFLTNSITDRKADNIGLCSAFSTSTKIVDGTCYFRDWNIGVTFNTKKYSEISNFVSGMSGEKILYHKAEKEDVPIDSDDLEFLRNITLLPGETLTVTDNHGRDVSYLMSDFINLKKAVEQ